MTSNKPTPNEKNAKAGATRAARPGDETTREKGDGAQARQDRRAALRAQQLKEQQAARRNKQLKVGALALAILVLVAGAGWLAWRYSSRPKETMTPQHAAANGTGITPYASQAKQGARSVVLYHDYQCIVCRQFDTRYGQQLTDLAKNGDIKLEFRTLTFLDAGRGAAPNQSSQRAAIAAACVDSTSDKYPDYLQTVYASQPESGVEGTGFTDDQLRNVFAGKAGLSGDALTKFQACYDERATKDFITKVDSTGQKTLSQLNKDGSIATPTLTVDDKIVDMTNLLSPAALARPADPNAIKLAIDSTK